MSIDEICEEFLDRLTVCAKEHKIQLDSCEKTLPPGLALHIFNAALHMLLEDLEGRSVIEQHTSVDFSEELFYKMLGVDQKNACSAITGAEYESGFSPESRPESWFSP